MPINSTSLTSEILNASIGAARGHAGDLRDFLEARARLIAEGIVRIEADQLAGHLDEEDVRFAFDEIHKSQTTAALAVSVTLKSAAQDAINAALAVARNALANAIGMVL